MIQCCCFVFFLIEKFVDICWSRKYMVTLWSVTHIDQQITSFPFALVCTCIPVLEIDRSTLSQCVTGISRCLENRMEFFSNNLLQSYVKFVKWGMMWCNESIFIYLAFSSFFSVVKTLCHRSYYQSKSDQESVILCVKAKKIKVKGKQYVTVLLI